MAGEAAIFRSAADWTDQGHRAYQALLAKVEAAGTPVVTLADLDTVDHGQFALLIEALVALAPVTGVEVAEDLITLAGLRPVAEVLGLP
jgi:hypothetical protein